MKKLLLFTFLISVTMSWGQKTGISLEKNTSKFISQLENRGIKSYFTTDRNCDAHTEQLQAKLVCDTNESYLARYIFWKESGVTMIKLIDNCGMFTSYTLKDAAIADYYTLHVQDLKTNEVKPYLEEANTDILIRRVGANNCRRIYMFKNAEGAFIKKYNMFDLSSEVGIKNINAAHNNSLPIVTLDKMLDNAINKMQTNSAWTRM